MTTFPHRTCAAAALLFMFLALAACSRGVEDFAFVGPDGRHELRSSVSLPKGAQGELLDRTVPRAGSSAPRSETALFSLADPFRVGPSESFALSYRGTGGLLHLFVRDSADGTAREMTARLPSSARLTAQDGALGSGSSLLTFLVPLEPGLRLDGFRVSTEASAGRVHILGAGIREDFPGIQLRENETLLRQGVSVEEERSGDGESRTLSLEFGRLVERIGDDQAQIAIAYRWAASEPGSGSSAAAYGGSSGDVTIVASAGSDEVRYRVRPRPGEHRLFLYTAGCGFTPRRLTIRIAEPGFSLRSIQVRRFAFPEAETGQLGAAGAPIPADFGTIISYGERWWRQRDYELFSWSLVPSAVILDFRNLETQSRFMKRLAFFVEKLGYAGTLLTNDALAGRHGWNAHDYRPEDLARFFTTAERSGFTLNPEEITLRRILLSTGLITAADGVYRPGEGAVITFSRTGSLALRRILLTHEGYHGLFFTSSEYRDRVFSIWEATDLRQQEIFRRFLRASGYDVDDPYLVVNEFQAYLMQQPVAAVESYFRSRIHQEILRDAAGSSAGLNAYFRDHPRLFSESARLVQDAVRSVAGVDAGDLADIRLLDD